MFATVKRWGNSYAIRLTKRDMENHDLEEGDSIKVEITRIPKGKIDLSKLPKLEDPDPFASEKHDEYLYGE